MATTRFTFGQPATNASSTGSGLFGATGFGSTAPKIGFGATTAGFGAGGLGTTSAGGFGTSTGFGTAGGFGTTGLGTSTTSAIGGFPLSGLQPSTQPAFGSALAVAPSMTGAAFPGLASSTVASISPFNQSQSMSVLGVASQPSSTSLGLFGGLSQATSQPILSGLLGSTTANTTGSLFPASTSIPFGTTAASSTLSRGLGGVDQPAVVLPAGGTATTASGIKQGDTALKDIEVPQPICTTVSDFEKFLKSQRSIREDIVRMSCKPMYRVQEEVVAMKRLLSVVSSGVRKNAKLIDKLKRDTAQELKFAEVAKRTKDIPPGLQYENVTPTEYFHRIVEDFEHRMVVCRQQIEEMEQHLSSLHNDRTIKPQDLSLLLTKINDNFLSLAAQLHYVHEGVKNQREHFLELRRSHYNDNVDIFTKWRKERERALMRDVMVTIGPTPFSTATNFNMAATSTVSKPHTVSSFAGSSFNPVATMSSQPIGSIFPTSGITQTATVAPFGSTFGSTSSQTPFGTPTTQSGLLSSTLGGSFGVTPPGLGGGDKLFNLQKPPSGSKRGKKF